MKRVIPVVLLLSATACSSQDMSELERVDEQSAALNGALNNLGFLTFRNLANQPDENQRRLDTTTNYYATVGTLKNGGRFKVFDSVDHTIANDFKKLGDFRARYFSGGFPEKVAKYYNRGDLGLGREMHCVDRTSDEEVACYVTNFVSAPLDLNGKFTEFSFGLSPEVAFDNMLADPPRPVATVAMVFRGLATADKVIFLAFNAVGALADNAPLDRHGISFANEFENNPNPDPEKFGVPGQHFNNHIPSNCLNCHGGRYQSASPHVSGAFFLPFDLDQFEYKQAAGLTRTEQLPAFRALNQMVRKVAFRSADVNHPIVQQIDGWHGNNVHGETLSFDFNENFVPTGWNNNSTNRDAYRSVVRPACRGCHMTVTPFNFDTADNFFAGSGRVADFVASNKMPHALQSQRLFWQSSQHVALVEYLSLINPGAAPAAAAASATDVITLDPHVIYSTIY
jgi:hypothetical protein